MPLLETVQEFSLSLRKAKLSPVTSKVSLLSVWHNFLLFPPCSVNSCHTSSSLFHEHASHAHAQGLCTCCSLSLEERLTFATFIKIKHPCHNYWHFKYIYLFILYIKSQQGKGFYQFYSLLGSLVLKTVPGIEWACNKYLLNELTTIKMVWFI